MTATLTPATRRRDEIRGMVWVTWRQHRWPIVIGVATLVLAAVMVFQAVSLIGEFPRTAHCWGARWGCGTVLGLFDPFTIWDGYLVVLLRVAPVLLAMFLGAPLLAREYEQRTHLLAWSQDVPPGRWLLTKLALIAGISVVLVAALSTLGVYLTLAMYGRSAGMSLVEEGERFEVAPLLVAGYTLFGLAVGVAASAVIRRVVPAMAATIGVFVLVRLAVVQWRPYFFAPLTASEPITDGIGPAYDRLVERFPNHLYIEGGCMDAFGRFGPPIRGGCPDAVAMVFQPAERLLTFRLIETSIFLLLTAVLVVFVWRKVRAGNVA